MAAFLSAKAECPQAILYSDIQYRTAPGGFVTGYAMTATPHILCMCVWQVSFQVFGVGR